MNLLGVIQEFCKRTALPSPTAVMSSQDDQLLQLVGLANEVIEDLIMRPTWTGLQIGTTFTTVAAESQGLLSTLAAYGFQWLIDNTMFNRTTGLPIFGPRSPQQEQAGKALGMTGPLTTYRIQQGYLLFYPTPTAGDTIAFEYASKYPILAVNDTTYKKFFTADTDQWVLDESLLLKGLRWMWKKEKGLAYAEDFRSYETYVTQSMAHDGTKANLNLNGQAANSDTPVRPGILVPSGSWSLP